MKDTTIVFVIMILAAIAFFLIGFYSGKKEAMERLTKSSIVKTFDSTNNTAQKDKMVTIESGNVILVISSNKKIKVKQAE